MAGMEATWWLDEHLEEWLGEKNAAGALIQSVPHNITSEMGLALLDVADTIRPHAEVVAFLQRVVDTGDKDDFLDELAGLPGGRVPRTPSGVTSTSTACAARARSTSPERGGRSAPPRSCPPFWATSRISSRVQASDASSRGFPNRGRRQRNCLKRLRALPDGERKGRGDAADDRPRPHLHRVPGVPQVRHGQPLLRSTSRRCCGKPSGSSRRACCPRRRTSTTSGSTNWARS